MDNELAFFKEQARKDLLSYSVYCDRFFEIHNHHVLISDALDKLVRGEIQNLIISMPPRAGKSRLMQEFISKLYGDSPKTDVLYTGHSLNLLEGFSRNIRNRIQTREYQSLYNTKISGDSGAVKNWNIEGGGEFAIYGVGGGITGKGGNYLIIDDPYSSRQDAESDTVRRTVSNWYWSTLLTRKQNDKAKQILIMQRWREDDLAGEILEREGEKWTELKIPAIDEKGESFWASKFSADYFNELKKQNPLFFESQYQQNPINSENGDFVQSYFIFYNQHELQSVMKHLNIVTFVDPAISQNQEADNTAIITAGIDSRNNFIYVLEVQAGKYLPDEIISRTFTTQRKWGGKVGVESIAYQKMLILEMQKQMRIRNHFFVLEEIRPNTEKNAKIRTLLQPRYASHSILHSAFMKDMEAELLKFPNGKHDDMCFVAGTQVLTESGYKDIKNIIKGEKVMTRKGLRKVICSSCTGEHEVINKLGLIGLGSHPIITKNGVIPLDKVSESDTLYIWNKQLSCIEEKLSEEIQTHRISNTEFIFGNMTNGKKHQSHFIGRFGLIISDLFLKTTIYTMKMAIHLIMILATGNVYTKKNMQSYITTAKKEGKWHQIMLLKIIQRCKKLQKFGEHRKNERNGTQNTQEQAAISLEKLSVLSVVKSALNILQKLFVVAKENVCLLIIGKSIMPEEKRKEKVYNLQVEGENEYFANGILVHNCDALSGCIQMFSTVNIDSEWSGESDSFI